MKKNVKKLLGIGFVGLAAVTAATAGVTAFGGFGEKGMFGLSQDMQDAIAAGDYDAYVDALSTSVSEDQFDVMVERFQEREAMHNAIADGDYEAYLEASDDSNRPVMSEEEFQDMVDRYEAHEKVEQAIEEENYDMWLSAVQTMHPDMADIVTEDEFALLIEMHDARDEGDFETARALEEELGLPGPMGHQKGHRGMGPRFEMNE